MAKNNGIDIGKILKVFTFSPLMIVLTIIGFVFTFGKIISVVTNPYVIAGLIFFNALLYSSGNHSLKNAALLGGGFGLVVWLINVATFYTNNVGICSIPIIGGFACGAVSVVSLLTDAFGLIIGGMIISILIGGFMLLFIPKRRGRR